MFLYLSKLLPLLVYPLGFGLILLVLALLLRKRLAWRTTLEMLALLILLLFSNQWVSHRLAQSLEWRYLPPESWPQQAVVVVLGGSTRPHQYPRMQTEISEAGDRLLFGARLYQDGVATSLVVTGGSIEWLGSSISEAAGMRELLLLMGVPDEAIVLEDRAQNTYDNAVFTREILAPQGVDSIVLVTSAMHMPRSVGLFEKQGFVVLPAPVDYMVTHGDPGSVRRPDLGERLLHLLPSVEYLELSTRALREYIGLMVYGMRGWL
jgi:uncharacterized SAM-binding protein YcdF (DUF218 family)